MSLIGLVRVSTSKQDTQRQHDALDPICIKVFEEKVSGKLAVDVNRTGFSSAAWDTSLVTSRVTWASPG